MQGITEKMKTLGLIPVVVLNDPNNAEPLAKALIDGGLPCAEITFRTDAAEESIRRIAKTYPQILLGAGTVLSIEQVKRAVSAGASFIVCPGFDPELVDYCIAHEIPVIPGCVTPSEIMQATKRGLTVLKIFPAEQYGGISMIKALAGPFTCVKFIPTGGVKLSNLKEYLASDKVLACGGTWMVKEDLIRNGEFDTIRKMTADAMKIVKEIRG